MLIVSGCILEVRERNGNKAINYKSERTPGGEPATTTQLQLLRSFISSRKPVSRLACAY